MRYPAFLSIVFSSLFLKTYSAPPDSSKKLSTLDSQLSTPAQRGYHTLRTKPFLPPDFDQEVFDNLWKSWPEPLRSQAGKASPQQRRQMAFSRYGLIEAPENKTGPALGYVDDGKGNWILNCFACHAGKVAGKVIPGLPNTHIALQTLTEEVRFTKLKLAKELSHLDLGSLKIPLGDSNGVTNSVIFGVALGALRDEHMNVVLSNSVPPLIHHGMDAPPWWNVKRKPKLYCDGFSPKNARILEQFILIPQNSPQTIKSWEQDYQDILAYIESLEPPKYPWNIDHTLAARGENIFNDTCSRCHGTYGENGKYKQKIIPIAKIGTDPVRLGALSVESRRKMQTSWLSHYGKDEVIVDPGGYVPPPLDGIWASAPYFHNGAVPTLWHVLNPDQRPKVWKRTEDGYDRKKLGLEITTFEKRPKDVTLPSQRREYFDTAIKGKSAAGHRFPEVLSEDQKQAVLEYLKTL